MADRDIPQPGPARLKRNAGPDEWLEAAKNCKYLSEQHMKQLCEIVKEFMMEGKPLPAQGLISGSNICLFSESNIQPVSTPVTICGDIHGQFYDVLELFRVSGGMPDEADAEPPKTQPSVITSDDIEPPSSISDKKNLRDSGEGEEEMGPGTGRTASGGSGNIELKSNFVFLGDYVDRGYFSLETLTLLLCLKAK